MTPDGEHEIITILKRISDSLERLSPPKESGPRKPAVLGTATYNIEERERQELRSKLRGSNGTKSNQTGQENSRAPEK